jgi:hypothetical protein
VFSQRQLSTRKHKEQLRVNDRHDAFSAFLALLAYVVMLKRDSGIRLSLFGKIWCIA